MQTQVYPGLSGIAFFAYFVCLTRDVLLHAFPDLSGSNFLMHCQNAINKVMMKRSPFSCLEMLKFSPTGKKKCLKKKIPGSIRFFDVVVTWKELASQKYITFGKRKCTHPCKNKTNQKNSTKPQNKK